MAQAPEALTAVCASDTCGAGFLTKALGAGTGYSLFPTEQCNAKVQQKKRNYGANFKSSVYFKEQIRLGLRLYLRMLCASVHPTRSERGREGILSVHVGLLTEHYVYRLLQYSIPCFLPY